MADGSQRIAEDARARAYSTPLEDFHVGDPNSSAQHPLPWFERLRKESRCTGAGQRVRPLLVGDQVQRHHGVTPPRVFSSESALGGITIRDARPTCGGRRSSPWTRPSTTCSARRSARSSPGHLMNMEPIIRERAAKILDELPTARPSTGSTSLHRADHPDAGDPVRLPFESGQADLLVRHRHFIPMRAAGGDRG